MKGDEKHKGKYLWQLAELQGMYPVQRIGQDTRRNPTPCNPPNAGRNMGPKKGPVLCRSQKGTRENGTLYRPQTMREP